MTEGLLFFHIHFRRFKHSNKKIPCHALLSSLVVAVVVPLLLPRWQQWLIGYAPEAHKHKNAFAKALRYIAEGLFVFHPNFFSHV